jgi:branched-chain amino acid transport system permease protein
MNWGVRIASIVVAIGACLILQQLCRGFGSDIQRLIGLAGLYVTLSVSLNLINGITGQFSIGHAAFYMIGAYSAGYISKNFYHGQMPAPVWLLLMMVVGALMASLAGFVVGLPSLRLRGDYLAIVTLGFGEIVRIVVQNSPFKINLWLFAFNFPNLGGAYALDRIPAIREIWLIGLLAILVIAVSRNLLKTAHGLTFLAVREDEVASLAMGVNVTRVKVTAFMIGAAFAGAAGALLAHYETSITPGTFGMDVSFIILTMVVLGGTGSITGSALAAVTLFALPEVLRRSGDVSGGALVGSIICIIGAVAAIRWLQFNYHGKQNRKNILYLSAIVGGAVLATILTFAFNAIPTLAHKTFEGSKLRMVIFAGSLIVIMLIRPQGVFAHHEFSWDWLKRVLGKKPKAVEA